MGEDVEKDKRNDRKTKKKWELRGRGRKVNNLIVKTRMRKKNRLSRSMVQFHR